MFLFTSVVLVAFACCSAIAFFALRLPLNHPPIPVTKPTAPPTIPPTGPAIYAPAAAPLATLPNVFVNPLEFYSDITALESILFWIE
jgi:hypothetical protein